MHGLGNDFVVIDDLPGDGARSPIVRDDKLRSVWAVDATLAREIGHRQFGVGFDQLLWLRPSAISSVDARMEIFNPDGSVAEMCGNGVRAAARYLLEFGPATGRDRYSIETLGGLKQIDVTRVGTEPPIFTVDMGTPVFGRGFQGHGAGTEVALTGLPPFHVYEVDMGNPHGVVFVEDLTRVPAEAWGPALETAHIFPRGANIEFAQVMGDGSLRVRVWERGAGLTLACGSGASAVAAAAVQLGKVRAMAAKNGLPWIQVHLPGGALQLSWVPGGSVYMRGPASFAFQGMWSPR